MTVVAWTVNAFLPALASAVCPLAQTRQTLDNLASVLSEAGSSLEQVLKTTVYVAAGDRSDLLRAWSVVEERLGASRPPSTLLGVSVLGYRDQLVEIEAVALRAE